MAVKSIVKVSELEGAKRLDAEYYQPKYHQALQTIKRLGYFPLKDVLTTLYRYPTFYNLEYQDTGVLVLKGEDIESSGLVDSKHSDHISAEVSSKFPKTILKTGDIILSVRGYVGKAGLIDSDLAGSQISPNLIHLEINRAKANPYFIWLFLNTYFGQSQLERAKMQTSQETILAGDIKSVLIPSLGKDEQERSERVANEAIKVFRKSKALYLQAEQILMDELGWDKLALSQPKSYAVSLSQAKNISRVDAEHFQPKYEKLLNYIKAVGKTDILGDVVLFNKRGLQPTYVEEGNVIVVNSQHLGRYLLNVEATERTDEDFWRNNKRCQLKINDVLVYSTGAYVGRTNVWLEDSKAIASNHVNIIRPSKEYNALYLAAYLNFLPGLWQAEMWASGSGQRELYPEDIARFVLYRAPQEVQEKIADLIVQSYQARKKAKALLEEVRKKIEEAIEEAAGK